MIISMLDYLKLKKRTSDGRMTEGDLRNKIREMVCEMNTTSDSNEEVSDFVINSFSDGDITMTYNELGHTRWFRFISSIIEGEISERNKTNGRKDKY